MNQDVTNVAAGPGIAIWIYGAGDQAPALETPAMPQSPEKHAPQADICPVSSPWNAGHGSGLGAWRGPDERMPLELVAAMSVVRRACLQAVPAPGVERFDAEADLQNVALHVAVSVGMAHNLLPALNRLRAELVARQHGTLATESAGHLAQLAQACDAIATALPFAHQLTLTDGKRSVESGKQVAQALSRTLNLPFVVASDKLTAITSLDTLLSLHSALKAASLALMDIAADVCKQAPDADGGAQCEALAMVCCQVLGHEVAMSIGVATGQFEDRPFKPLVAHTLLQNIRLLSDATTVFTEFAVCQLPTTGSQTGGERASNGSGLASSLMLVTARAGRAD